MGELDERHADWESMQQGRESVSQLSPVSPRPRTPETNLSHAGGTNIAASTKHGTGVGPRNNKRHVTIYTDGACKRNPGPGGYGVVLIDGEHRRELSGGYRRTTNNRMELMGPIRGLAALSQSCRVTLYSDSRYVVNGIEKGWAKRWRAKEWMRNKQEGAINPDLWGKLLDLCEIHEVEFRWVKGHTGNRENERCDRLAVQATRQDDLPPDEGYGSPHLGRLTNTDPSTDRSRSA